MALKRDRNVGFRSENGGGVKKIAILARCEEKGVGGPRFCWVLHIAGDSDMIAI